MSNQKAQSNSMTYSMIYKQRSSAESQKSNLRSEEDPERAKAGQIIFYGRLLKGG
jgi:hypothetical protein